MLIQKSPPYNVDIILSKDNTKDEESFRRAGANIGSKQRQQRQSHSNAINKPSKRTTYDDVDEEDMIVRYFFII